MGIETESKYEADADAILPRLDILPGVREVCAPTVEQLDAEYFDTPDLRLLRAGITLRRRTGGHDAGWHLKLPVGPGSREEIRLPLGGTSRRVPAELTSLVKARTRGARLAAVAAIATARQLTTLLGPDGESLAEVADDDVRGEPLAGATGQAARWREIEVELTGGNRDMLDAADKVLRQAGLRRSDRSAKVERVLGGSLANPPPRLPARPTAGDAVGCYLREHVRQLVALDPMVRRREPDAVHRMRVAARRLRSTLRTFAAVIGDEVGDAERDHVAAELQWLGRTLGRERDAEVQAGRLQDHVRATDASLLLGPVPARIGSYAAKAEARGHSAVTAALNSGRYLTLLDALDALICEPLSGHDAERPAGRILPAAVRRSYRKTGRRMRVATAESAGPARDAALHAARKAAKRTRYAAEAAIPAGGADAARFARRMSKLQSVLGDRQDTVVGRQELRKLGRAAQRAGEDAFSYGLFYGREACRAQHLDLAARRAWHRASRRRYRRWSSDGRS